MSKMLEHALKYALHGWGVFPLAPCKKTPITAHGVKDATTDEVMIRQWWEKWPDANIAVACGQVSGVYVIDVDEDSAKGISGINSLVTEFDPLPATVQQSTPRGGFHVFYKTDVPPANRNSFRPGIDIRGDGYYVVLAPSVHPNGGVYSWKPRCSPWEVAVAEYPDYMRPLSPVVGQTIGQIDMTKPFFGTSDGAMRHNAGDLLVRAAKYVRECDTAVQGLGGHDKLFWAAQCMVNGFRLSDDDAYSILASEYNPYCVPPWDLANDADNRDFRHKISEARKTPPGSKAVGWLLDDSYRLGELDMESAAESAEILIEKMKKGKFDLVEFEKGEAKRRSLYEKEHDFLVRPTGFLGKLCHWINETSMRRQPLLTLGCSIAFLGSLFGRKVRDTLGNRTNIYCMGIGDSSSGKGHAPGMIFKLCEASNCLDLIGGSNTTSDSAIEERMSNYPSTVFFWDEIGHLLSDFRTGQNKGMIVPTLMSIWSSAGRTYLGREYADKEKQRIIVQPNLCIWGTATPDRFARGMTPEEVRDGWVSRVLAFQTYVKPPVNEDYIEAVAPEHLIEACRQWIGRGRKVINGTDLTVFATPSFTETPPSQIVVPVNIEAKRRMKAFREFVESKCADDDDLDSLWAKAVEQAYRIALIIASSEGTPEIEINASIADYACRLVAFLLLDFAKIILPRIAGSELEVAKMKIVDVVGEYGKTGCTKSQLTRKTQWACGTAREGMIRDLLEARQLVCRRDEATMFFWTEDNFLRVPACVKKK